MPEDRRSHNTLRLDQSTICVVAPAPVRRAQTAPTGTVTLLFGTLVSLQWRRGHLKMTSPPTRCGEIHENVDGRLCQRHRCGAVWAADCGQDLTGRTPLTLGCAHRRAHPRDHARHRQTRLSGALGESRRATHANALVVSETTRSSG